jgi:RNA polymerase sigma-70 factor (ECF subfamily)
MQELPGGATVIGRPAAPEPAAVRGAAACEAAPASCPPGTTPSAFAIDVPASCWSAPARRRRRLRAVYRWFERPVFTWRWRRGRPGRHGTCCRKPCSSCSTAPRLPRRLPVLGWLRQIAVNEALMRLRKRGRRSRRRIEEGDTRGAGRFAATRRRRRRAAARALGGAAGRDPQRAVAVPRRGLHPRGESHVDETHPSSFSKSQLSRGHAQDAQRC